MYVVHIKKWKKSELHLRRLHAVNILPKYIGYLFLLSFLYLFFKRFFLIVMSLKLKKNCQFLIDNLWFP